MANHKSSIKRIRQTEARRMQNKYNARTMRKALRNLRAISVKSEATVMVPVVSAMIDKLAKKNVIHRNKAANLKSGIQIMVNNLA